LFTLQPGMVHKVAGLFDCVIGLRMRPTIVAVSALLAWWAAKTGWLRRARIVWLLFLSLSAAAYLLLPLDWMPLFRFATPFIVLLVGFCVALASAWVRATIRPAMRQLLSSAIALIAVAGTLDYYAPLTAHFREYPTVPFATVAQAYGERFNAYAERLGVTNGSLFLPDLGGTLTYSGLRVCDLAGLCDRTTGRTLGRDPDAYRDYVFEVVRPTFIHAHDFWARIADLEADPRFRRDYLPLFEIEDPWIAEHFHICRHSGDWVRRDAVAGNEASYQALCAECSEFWNEFLYAPRYRHLFPLMEAVQARRTTEPAHAVNVGGN
jgi:hypothetical protein